MCCCYLTTSVILSKQTSLISWFHFRRSYFGLDEGWVLIADAMLRFESFSKSDFGTAPETSAIQKINSPHETEKVSESFFEGRYFLQQDANIA